MAYILSVKMDAVSFDYFDELRRAHFPASRNFLSAHLTLFHALPDLQLPVIKNRLREMAAMEVFPIRFTTAQFMGFGTCVAVDSEELLDFRKSLAASWLEWLSAQDRQKYRPHVTIQNKVPPSEAKEFFARFSAGWSERMGSAEGFLLWEYLNGPWRLEEEFNFKKD